MPSTSPSKPTASLIGLGVVFLLLVGTSSPTHADDWPTWRGPTHDGISAEKGWSPAAVAQGKVLWSAQVGVGHASFAVAGGKVYTLGNAEGQDTVYCFDAETGEEIWQASYACPAGNYAGPRGTPTVDDGLVFTMSREGHLHCYDANSGEEKWAKKVNTTLPRWGIATSPIVHGDLVVVNAGDAGAAYKKKTGKRAWASKSGTPGYASPVVMGSGSKLSFLIFGKDALHCVAAKSGRKRWDFSWPTRYDVNAADPVLVGKNGVFISSGYGTGCAMLKATSRGVSEVWKNRNMSTHMGTCVLHEDHLYGMNEKTLTCIDAAKGDVQWTKNGFGKGGMMLADGKLIIISEDGGNLVIAEANPKTFVEVARAKVTGGHTWTPPVLANGRIYCRNDRGDIVCVDARGD